MLTSRACFARWQLLLDEEIEREVRLYRDQLAAGTVTAAWRAQIAAQCVAWRRELQTALASSLWTTFCTRYPGLDTAVVNEVLADLAKIEAAFNTTDEHIQLNGVLA